MKINDFIKNRPCPMRHSVFKILIAIFIIFSHFFFHPPSASADITTGLVGYWPLDGNTNDLSGNNNNGTNNGATFITGKMGQGASFDGSTSYISMPDSDPLDPSEISISTWVYASSNQTSSGNIVNKGNNNGYRFRIGNDGKIKFFDRGATNSVTTTSSIPLNQWNHIVVTGGSSGLKI